MPEKPRNKIPAPDPATDIFLCRTPPATNGPVMPEGNCTRLFAHPVAGSTPLFYLTYRSGASDPPLIRRFESPTDAAAFILGLAGQDLAGIPGPEQHRIRQYFPDWFRPGDADTGNPPARAGVELADPGRKGDTGDATGREPPGIPGRDPRGNRNYFPRGSGNGDIDTSHPEIPEQNQQKIREYFPGWSGTRDADDSDLGTITPCSPVKGCDTGHEAARRPEIPTDPSLGIPGRDNRQSPGPGPDAAHDPAQPVEKHGPAEVQPFLPEVPGDATTRHGNPESRDSPVPDTPDYTAEDIAGLYSQTPAPDPASSVILYRSLRYSIRDGSLIENGTDLLATRDPACFWFRHWTWDGGKWLDRCGFATRNEAVEFIREQFAKPGLFSGWNHRGIREFLPEVYGKG